MLKEIDIEKKKATYRLALFMGELMLKSGAETYRIEDSIIRVCRSRGFTYTNVFVTPTVIIISDERYDGVSFMKSIESRDLNLNRIALLNSFSREFVSNQEMSLSEARKKLKQIESSVEYTDRTTYLGMSLGAAAYSLLLGCSFNDFIFTFLVSIIIFKLCNKLNNSNYIPFFSTIMTSLFIALAGSLLKTLGLVDDSRMIIIGGIVPLFPGVNLIKGVRDLISGNLLSGLAKAFEACVTAVAIATGVGIVLNMWTVFGGAL